jgi:hypothetical protein
MKSWCCEYYSVFTYWTILHSSKASLKCEINTDNELIQSFINIGPYYRKLTPSWKKIKR